MNFTFEPIFDSSGKVNSIIRRPDGAAVAYDSTNNTFDEENPVTKSLREYEAENGKLNTDRPLDPVSLDQAKAQKKQEIIAIASAKQEELVAGFAPPEQASWTRKVTEAKAFLATGEIKDAPMLKAEGAAISGSKNEAVIYKYCQGLAAKVLQKSEEMYISSAEIAGKRTNLLAQVDAAKAFEGLNAIVWN